MNFALYIFLRIFPAAVIAAVTIYALWKTKYNEG